MVPIYEVCAANPSVRSRLLSPDGQVRLFGFGEAEQGMKYPYAVWQRIFGQPVNYMADRADMDSNTIQVDVYAKSSADAEAVAEALRGAIEPHAYITRLGGTEKEPKTKTYRYSFDVEWHVER